MEEQLKQRKEVKLSTTLVVVVTHKANAHSAVSHFISSTLDTV